MIIDLHDKPEYIPTLAAWHHQEWGHLNPGDSLETRIEKMREYLSSKPIPKMLIWIEAQAVIGSAGVLACDMDTRPELTPWLASVFVKPELRGKGIGSLLVKGVMDYAARQGFSELFLFTPDQEAFYQKLGWQTISREEYRGVHVSVMRVDLTR